MSFKLHLLIVSLIILAVYMIWHFASRPDAVRPDLPAETSPYSLVIVHASWGLNCSQSADASAAFSDSAKLREDNVLTKVSELCNGQSKCSIPINTRTLGDDPAPSCSKALNVEYRCFSYDRPWNVKAFSGVLTIDCDKTLSEKP